MLCCAVLLTQGFSGRQFRSDTYLGALSLFSFPEFWENWYIIGENDPGMPEFKFVYYNGKTRQNTYEGAFVYSRSRTLEPESMKKVYAIAKSAGMNPDQFCRIRNGCFNQEEPMIKSSDTGLGSPSDPFRGFIASTKVSELLGVKPVSAEDDVQLSPTSQDLLPRQNPVTSRPWWYEVGDYLENPHRHFEAMDSLRQPMEWPENIREESVVSSPSIQLSLSP